MSYPATERRSHHALREIFAEACLIIAPVIKDADSTLGVSSFSMMHILQDHYPQLTSSEIHVMVSTIERLHRENRLRQITA